MKELGEELGIPIDVYGPETHMTRIVNMALEGKKEILFYVILELVIKNIIQILLELLYMEKQVKNRKPFTKLF